MEPHGGDNRRRVEDSSQQSVTHCIVEVDKMDRDARRYGHEVCGARYAVMGDESLFTGGVVAGAAVGRGRLEEEMDH